MQTVPPVTAELAPPSWKRGLEPMRNEHTKTAPLRIEGRLPPELRGTLFRNGAGQNEIFGVPLTNWIDGDGMVSAFHLDGNTVSYSNRYVRTPQYVKELAAQRLLYPNFGTLKPGGPLRNAFRQPKNTANTNVVYWADRLLALWEGGRPFSLDPLTLETRGEESFGGTLPKGSFFSAHPHQHPVNRDLFNIGSIMGKNPGVQPWRVSKDGRATRLPKVSVDKLFVMHDFGLTATKLVLMGGPYYIDLAKIFKFLLGTGTIFDAITWHPNDPLRVYVVDLAGSAPIRKYELPASQPFHIGNAHDDGGDVVIDSIIYPSGDCFRDIVGFRGLAKAEQFSVYTRTRLFANGKHSHERLADGGLEFPRINPRFDGVEHRYSYGIDLKVGAFSGQHIVKVDSQRQRTWQHAFGEGCYPGEAVFVPRAGATDEDDGWLLSLVYDSRDHHSFLAVINANPFGAEETRVHFPFHVPLGFHGNFVRG